MAKESFTDLDFLGNSRVRGLASPTAPGDAMKADPSINAQTGTTYTLVPADFGKVVTLSNAAAITVTLPNDSLVGFNTMFVQLGAGQVTFALASGAVLRQRQSFTKTAGQFAAVSLFVLSNSSGVVAEYLLVGDMA